MADPVNIAAKTKSCSKKKLPDDPAGLPHEIDSAGRTRATTCILVNLPKSSTSAPATLNEMSTSTEFPTLGDTRAVTADGAPLPVPFSYDVSESGDVCPPYRLSRAPPCQEWSLNILKQITWALLNSSVVHTF
jgi:hypothetical protein